jgi:hypothetical protein
MRSVPRVLVTTAPARTATPRCSHSRRRAGSDGVGVVILPGVGIAECARRGAGGDAVPGAYGDHRGTSVGGLSDRGGHEQRHGGCPTSRPRRGGCATLVRRPSRTTGVVRAASVDAERVLARGDVAVMLPEHPDRVAAWTVKAPLHLDAGCVLEYIFPCSDVSGCTSDISDQDRHEPSDHRSLLESFTLKNLQLRNRVVSTLLREAGA